MELRTSSLSSHPSRTRLQRDASLTRFANRTFWPDNRLGCRVASTGDFETEEAGKNPDPEETSRKKLEVVTGLLREGYGVGAILTAAAFKGASFTSNVLKGMSESGTAAFRRQRICAKILKRRHTSMVKTVQRAVSEVFTGTSTSWKRSERTIGVSYLKSESLSDKESHSNDIQDSEEHSESLSFFEEDIPSNSESSTDVELHKTKTENGESNSDDIFEDEFSDFIERDVFDGDPSNHAEQDIESERSNHDEQDVFESVSAFQEVLQGEDISDAFFEPSSFSTENEAFSADVEIGDQSHVLEDLKDLLGIPQDKDVSSRHINEASLKPSAFIHAAEGLAFDPVISTQLSSEAVLENDEAAADSVAEELNDGNVDVLEDLVQKAEEEDSVKELKMEESTFEEKSSAESSSSSLAVNKAMEILDEIANFEIETGESVDSSSEENSEEEVIVPERQTSSETRFETERRMEAEAILTIGDMKRAEEEEELRRQMRMETDRRLNALRLQNKAKREHRRDAPVKVERPSKHLEVITAETRPSKQQGYKGLDFIKSYTEKNRSQLEAASKDASSFFKPPTILQDAKRETSKISSSKSSSYSDMDEINRLKNVREIGTVMWSGNGGTGGSGGFGGSGGGRGGRGRGSDGSDDKYWWVQVRCLFFVHFESVFEGWVFDVDHDGFGVCFVVHSDGSVPQAHSIIQSSKSFKIEGFMYINLNSGCLSRL